MRQVEKNLNIIYYRTIAELRSEASNSYAGYIWWVLQPLLALAVYYVAFRWLIPYPNDNFTLFLFIGITVWQFWANSLIRAAGTLIVYRPLMLQLNIAKAVFPLTVTMVNLVKFIITLLLLISLALFLNGELGITMIALPLLIVLLLFLVMSASLLVAAITPFFPDLIWLIEFFLHLMIFLSGVFFEISILPETIQEILMFNPMAVLITQFRVILLYNQYPHPAALAVPIVYSVAMFLFGVFLLHKFDKKYPRMA